VLGGVTGHHDQHLAPRDHAAPRVGPRAVEILARQAGEAFRDALPQLGPSHADGVGHRRRGRELGGVAPAVSLAAQGPEQVLLGIAEHVGRDGVQAVGRGRGRTPVELLAAEPVERADDAVDGVEDVVLEGLHLGPRLRRRRHRASIASYVAAQTSTR